MTRALIYAAAFSLLLPGLSLAQSNMEKKGGESGHAHGQPAHGQPAHGQPARRQPAGGHAQGMRPGENTRAGQPMRQVNPRAQQGMRTSERRYPVTIQPLPPRGNDFWHRGRYYGRVHGPAYAYPRGWQYRRWVIGDRLPGLFFVPAFIYAGWAALGLQPPVPGYAWVRFGPDLVLVNQTTGEVEDVVYWVFY